MAVYSGRVKADNTKVAHHLLLADDSVTIQRVIKLTFADEDVEVMTVGDGNQAVASIDKQPPDIVLADIAMPGRSGYEVAQHIRNTPRLAHIPVLLLTGAFEPVDEVRASEVGCDGVLAKPFEPDVVVSRVKELLSKPRAVAAAVAPAAATVKGPFPAPVPPAAPLVFPLKDTASPAFAAAPASAEVAAPPPRPSATDVDAYFDRLDQAFATLALSPRTPAPAPVEAVDPGPAMPQSLVEGIAGLAAPNTSPAPAPAPVAAATWPEAVTPAATWPSAVAPTATPLPPTTASPATAMSPPTLTDAQVESIVDRVIERLTARLGTNASEVVSTVAERIVRAEIEQIKKRV